MMSNARLAALFFAPLALAACGAPDVRAEAPVPAVDTVAAVAAPPAAATPEPPRADAGGAVEADSLALTAEGWGPLRIGMTRAEMVAAAGDDANPEAVGGPDPESCDELRPRQAPEGMLVMLLRGVLARITVSEPADVRTASGISIGDPASKVREVHGDGLLATPHQYIAAPAEYLTAWKVAPPSENARGIRYEIGLDGRVMHIHAGGPSIEYVEGCV